jgi:hypothetical protein
MLANTLTITVNAVPVTLVRVNQDNEGSKYIKKTSLQSDTLYIRNSYGQVVKGKAETFDVHNLSFERIVYATPTVNEKTYTASATFRMNRTGDPETTEDVAIGFMDLAAAQISAIVDGES